MYACRSSKPPGLEEHSRLEPLEAGPLCTNIGLPTVDVQWLGVMPRLVSKNLSSRATRYIHCRPSPSPSWAAPGRTHFGRELNAELAEKCSVPEVLLLFHVPRIRLFHMIRLFPPFSPIRLLPRIRLFPPFHVPRIRSGLCWLLGSGAV